MFEKLYSVTLVMLSRSCQGLLATTSCLVRQIASSARVMEGEVATSAEFAGKVAAMTNIEPAFPSDFLKDIKIASTEGQSTPTKLKLTFALPHQVIMSNAEVLAT